MERQYQPQDQVHTHVNKNLSSSNGGQSKSVDQLDTDSGDLSKAPCSLGSLESHSSDSLNEQPKKNLLRKWHRKQ